MIWFLAVVLVALLLISYILNGKDFFAPATMLLIAFIFSAICSIYNINIWKYRLGVLSTTIVIISVIITTIINIYIHSYYRKKRINSDSEKGNPLPLSIILIFLVIMLFSTYIQLNYVKKVVRSNNIWDSMYSYRLQTSYGYGNFSVPGYVTQLNHLSTAICYICVFNVIVFFKRLKKYRIIILTATVLCWILKNILNAARFEIFSLFINALFIFNMNRIRLFGGYKVYKIRSIIRLILIAILFLALFYYLKDFVGRKSNTNVFEYIAKYCGSEIPNFDLFLKDFPQKSSIFGKETFYSLLQWMRRRGIIKIPEYTIHKEFR